MVIKILTYVFFLVLFLRINISKFFVFSSLALTHLFVARFIQQFMHSKGLCNSIEPFKRFIPIGNMIFHAISFCNCFCTHMNAFDLRHGPR